jgi:hypothetical protein
VAVLAWAAVGLAAWSAQALAGPEPAAPAPRALPIARAAVNGDLEAILAARKRRIVVLVAYSRTL